LGAESPEGFLDLEKMGFPNFKIGEETIFNRLRRLNQGIEGLRQCDAVTVNRVSGTTQSIADMQQLWAPEVETMEGAAFFQACLLSGVPFHAIRGISNRVEPRNRSHWKVREAAEAAQIAVLKWLDELHLDASRQ
jgi:futalosine hydrolase